MLPTEKKMKGALLINVGTPEKPEPAQVRTYLKEFLMDPLVLDVAYPIRWMIVNGTILPKRSKSSAAAYQKIWTDRGSPLLYHLNDLTQKVQKKLGDGWIVKSAMRYGTPSIQKALLELSEADIHDIVIFPLYPQYSLAATESSIRECLRVAQRMTRKTGFEFRLQILDSFYKNELFIKAFAQIAEKSLSDYRFDHLLFSFHGLPERQVKKTGVGDYCFSKNECCAEIMESNQKCYRAQCYTTARLIAQKMGVSSDRYTVSFQSRLGSTPWIKPYTDVLYRELPLKGIKRLVVMCPAFVADCLETLEEIQIRGREDFIRNGGEELKLVPSLNSSEVWASAVSSLMSRSD